MKFSIATIFSIQIIISTNIKKISNNANYIDIQPTCSKSFTVEEDSIFPSCTSPNIALQKNTINKLRELYDVQSSPDSMYQYSLRWAIHYIFCDKDRHIIKDEVLETATNILNTKYLLKNRNRLIKYWENFVKIIKNDKDPLELDDLTLSTFISHYFSYERRNTNFQIVKLKNNIFSMIKSRKIISNLRIFNEFTVSDLLKLLLAMRLSLKELDFYNINGKYILDVLNMFGSYTDCTIKLQLINLKLNLTKYKNIIKKISMLKISDLYITNCHLNSQIPIIGSNLFNKGSSMFEYLGKSNNIKTLKIIETDVTDEDIKYITNALGNDSSPLNDLTFAKSKLNIKLMCKKFKNCKKLLKLSLKYYKIRPKFSKSLSKLLDMNETLHELSLTNNEILQEDVEQIAIGLETNIGLRSIDFSNTTLNIRSFTRILNAIANNKLSKLEKITFKSKNINLYNLTNRSDFIKFFIEVKRIKDRNINLNCNWLDKFLKIT